MHIPACLPAWVPTLPKKDGMQGAPESVAKAPPDGNQGDWPAEDITSASSLHLRIPAPASSGGRGRSGCPHQQAQNTWASSGKEPAGGVVYITRDPPTVREAWIPAPKTCDVAAFHASTTVQVPNGPIGAWVLLAVLRTVQASSGRKGV